LNPRIPAEQGPQPCAFSKLGNLRFSPTFLPTYKKFSIVQPGPTNQTAIFLNPPPSIHRGGFMNTIRQQAINFLFGLVVGLLVASILILLFQYTEFAPLYSHMLALFAGGCITGIITRGTWKGGISAFFAGFFALLIFETVKDVLTLDYQFSPVQVLTGLLCVIAGGILGGFLTRPTILVVAQPKGEPQKVYVCPQCGAEIPMKTKFCPECGTRLGKAPITEKIKEITQRGGEES
jgi:hypothetical protein